MRRDLANQREALCRAGAAARRRLARARCAAVLGFVAAAALLAGCNKASPASAAAADASAASAVERDAALTEAIRTGMQRASIPGAIVGVWREGQPPYVRAFGVRDTASGAPMATDLHMRIGSATKAFVVTGILMLADQGKLGLDDPIDRYVKGAPSGDRITLRQLAQMRSGLYNYADDTNKDLPQQPFRKWTPRELLEVAFRHPIVFPPGTKFDYCNTNTVLLGLALETVAGQSLASFIEQNILKPQGMTHTVFPAGAEIPSPHAHGYFKMPDGKVVDATDWNYSWGWAAGNMISTLDDMRVWARDLAIGKLISPAMKREQQQFLPAPEEGDGALYGLALENQNGWIGHNGNTMSYMAYPYYLPSERMTMVVMLNSGADIPGSWMMIQDRHVGCLRVVAPRARRAGELGRSTTRDPDNRRGKAMAQPTAAQRMEQVIRAYIQACNDADAKAIAACFVREAVHYFPSLAKWVGAATIGNNFEKRVREHGHCWTVDQLVIDSGRFAATLEWTRFDRQHARILCGVDWFVFEPETFRVREIRPYTAAPVRPDPACQELQDFDYVGRGYPTTVPRQES